MIEDVDYLKKNSEADSIAFFADSTLRNQKVHPNPSEFHIEFTQPFKNVFGFDILDASIPATMYNVDIYNCILDITLIKSSNNNLYPISTTLNKLSFVKRFGELFESDIENYIVFVKDNVSIEVVDTITEYRACQEHYIDNVPFQKVRIVPVVSEWGSYTYVTNNSMFLRFDNTVDENIASLLRKDDIYIEYDNINNTYRMYYYDFFDITAETYGNLKASTSTYYATFTNLRRSIEIGNYDVPGLKTEINTVFNGLNVFVESTTVKEIKQGIYKFNSYDFMLLNANKKNLCETVGFNLYPQKNNSKYGYASIRGNDKIYTSVIDTVKNIYTLTAPGIVNLMGERFIILRCKEIEDHLHGSFSYSSYIPGIAMFKMGAVNDVSNLRFDFVSLVRKPFHPIGKISRLTFRFETVSGRLYDFKGVNLQMLLMIKFLVPSQKQSFERSILNPNYNSNFIEYMTNQKGIEQHDNSDNEEEFDNEDNFIIYKKKLDELDNQEEQETEEENDSTYSF